MKKRFTNLLIITSLGGLVIYIAFNSLVKTKLEEPRFLKTNVMVNPSQPQGQTVSTIPSVDHSANFLKLSRYKPNEERNSLEMAVDNILAGTEGTYGVVIKNLKTSKAYYLNEHRIFEPGSLYKIWVLATAFNQIEEGNLKEEEILSQDVSVLNRKFDIDLKYAEATKGRITFSVKETMEQMITISHNYAALLLSERVKLSSMSAFLKEHHLNESALGQPPQTTPYDIALFFEKLYKGEFANEENTQKMLAIFKRQALNNKLPKYLPQDTLIAHKTGEIGFFTHDAGIVFLNKGDYIIVVMSESSSPVAAEEKIAEVSQTAYNYFLQE